MSIPAIGLPVVSTSGNGVSPININVVGHGLTTSTVVSIAGVVGNTAANVSGAALTVVDANNFTVPGTGNGAYVSGGTVWVNGSRLTSAKLTSVDSALATRVTDKTGDTVAGPVGLNAASNPVMTTSAGAALTAGAAAGLQTQSGGRIQHADGDDILLTGARATRTVLMSMAELFNDFSEAATFGTGWVTDFATMGVRSGMAQSQSSLVIPLSRLHHGGTLQSVTLYFRPQLVNAQLAVLPAYFPMLGLARINPATDTVATVMAAPGLTKPNYFAQFPAPTSASAYAQTSAVGSTGNIVLATINGGSASVSNGSILTDSSGQAYQTTNGGTFTNGTPIPIKALAPSSGAFLGVNTNLAGGTVLTWGPAPTNVLATANVAAAGLAGGLNAGYAQSLTFTPYTTYATIDQSTYAYFLVLFDDSVYAPAATPNGWAATVYTGLRFVYSISSLAFQ